MKQTKKLTRHQREYLEHLKVYEDGMRLVLESCDCIVVQTADGELHTYDKE